MTAITQTRDDARPRRRQRPWLQPALITGGVLILAPASVALGANLLSGRPLPWQFHMPWVSPHVAVALLVLALGALQLGLPKGDRRHRMIGYGWCALMAFIGASGLLIQLEPGHVTFVHLASSLFSIADLILLPIVIFAARTRRRRLHRNAALGLYACVLNAGALAFIPQRALGALLLGLLH